MAPRRKWVRKIIDPELDPCVDDDRERLQQKMRLAKQRLASVKDSIQALDDALNASSGLDDEESTAASHSDSAVTREGLIQQLVAGVSAKDLFNRLQTERVDFIDANRWSTSRSSLQRTIFDLVKCIVLAMSQDPNREIALEQVRDVLKYVCESCDEKTYGHLFQICCILVSSSALGNNVLVRLVTPTLGVDCPNLKAFIYPYLVSKRFRHAMVMLASEIASKFEVCHESVSLDARIESWESPALLKIIDESYTSWSVVMFSEPVLSAMHAEAVTAISMESADMCTIICERRLPSIGQLEQSLSIPEMIENEHLQWDKIRALELLLHEFCRVWRRMLEPSDDYSTPRGIGNYDKPNAGCRMDALLWGPFLSVDVRDPSDGIVLYERANTLNMNRALNVESWDDPEATFFWTDRPFHSIPNGVTSNVSHSDDRRRRGPLPIPGSFLRVQRGEVMLASETM